MPIRPATEADAGAITAIYNEGIADRVATFETRPREVHEVAAWLSDGLPLLVATRRTARCSGSPACRPTRTAASTRASASTASTSPARRAGRSVGRRLLEALAAASEQAGYYKLTSRVFADNAASRAVHLAAGFTEVGIQRRHGRLDGEWKDCVLVERLLGEAAASRARPSGSGCRPGRGT